MVTARLVSGQGVSPAVLARLSARCGGGALHKLNGRDFQRLNWLAILIIQQFCAVSDRGGAPLAEDHVAIAFCCVHRVAAVLTHPSLELTGRVFYDRDSAMKSSKANSAGRGSARKGYGGTLTNGGAGKKLRTRIWRSRVGTHSDYSLRLVKQWLGSAGKISTLKEPVVLDDSSLSTLPHLCEGAQPA